MKERIYKLFLTLLVSLSLGAGPIAQHEIAKLLEMFVETGDAQIQELDDEENESEEIRNKKEERLVIYRFIAKIQMGCRTYVIGTAPLNFAYH